MTGAGFVQALVLGGLGQPVATRKQVHHQAVAAGVQVSVQGLDQRFTQSAVDLMKAMLEETLTHVVRGEREQVPLPHFVGVYVTDCSRLVWGESGIKLGVQLEIQCGALQACVMDLNTHDQKASVVETDLPVGALHLVDLGFFKLKRLRRWSSKGVYWLTRYKVGTHLYTLAGQRIDLVKLLQGTEALCVPVCVGKGKEAIHAFLHAAPLTPEALEKRMQRLNEQARLDQRPLSQAQRDLATWTLYLTNVPDLTFAQAHILNRTRWQIELLFKLWKSHAQVLHSRSHNAHRQLCEGYGKLIGVIVAHWSLLIAGWRYEQVAALDALRILRAYVPLLQRALIAPHFFADFFATLHHALSHAPVRAKRRKTPLAFQLWRDFEMTYA